MSMGSASGVDISKLCNQERLDEAFQALESLLQQGIPISRDIIYLLLQSCIKKKDIEAGRRVRSLIVRMEFDSSSFLGFHLIRLFVLCGSLLEADQVFSKVSNPNVYTWNEIILAHAKLGEAEKALELYYKMLEVGVKPDKFVFSSILKVCGRLEGIEQGKVVHDQIIRMALESELVLGNTLLDMYVKCRILYEACIVFDNLWNRDLVSWGTMIAGYTQHGHGHIALCLFEEMQQEGIACNSVILLCVSKACSSIGAIGKGRLIHECIIASGLESDVFLGSALIDMYAKCDSLEDAQRVFDNLPNQNVAVCGAMITGYAQQGHGLPALEIYELMLKKGLKPDKSTLLGVLTSCVSIGETGQGRGIHNDIVRCGVETDTVLGTALVNLYVKYRSLEDARKVFDELLQVDMVSYGAMIAGYAQEGLGVCALDIFAKMQNQGLKPNKITLACVVKACSSIGAIGQGRLIHEQIIKTGAGSDAFIGSALVDMYAKCGSLGDACEVFDELPERDLVTWGTMIEGYLHCGDGHVALELFQRMSQECVHPDKFIFSSILKACGSMGASKQGRLTHNQIVKSGLDSGVVVGNSLIDMYAKCRSLEDAHKVFDSLSNRHIKSWGALIVGYSQHGHGLIPLKLCDEMQLEGIKPDEVIFSCISKALSRLGAVPQGNLLHDQILKSRFASNVAVGNAVVDMYAKCGSLEDARMVFDKLANRDIMSWGAMIEGYADNGYGVQALEIFERMQQEGIGPSKITFLSVLKACWITGAIGQGELIHDQIIRNELELDRLVGSTLVDMYAKCGIFKEALKIFDTLIRPDVVSWGALIAGYARCANYEMAMRHFENMQYAGFRPNDIILLNILATCSHAGLLEEGSFHFSSMNVKYGITPDVQHHSCMIDLLVRSGHLEEADDLLQTLPMPPNSTTWMSYLAGCGRYGNLELGKWSFDQVSKLNPNDAAGYVTMANIYVDAYMWDSVGKIQKLMNYALARKIPGRSWIVVKTRVHEFTRGDEGHAQNNEIYTKLKSVNRLSKGNGHVPRLDF